MLISKPRIEAAEQSLSELSLCGVMSCLPGSAGSLPRSSSQGRFGAPRCGGLGLKLEPYTPYRVCACKSKDFQDYLE